MKSKASDGIVETSNEAHLAEGPPYFGSKYHLSTFYRFILFGAIIKNNSGFSAAACWRGFIQKPLSLHADRSPIIASSRNLLIEVVFINYLSIKLLILKMRRMQEGPPQRQKRSPLFSLCLPNNQFLTSKKSLCFHLIPPHDIFDTTVVSHGNFMKIFAILNGVNLFVLTLFTSLADKNVL